MNLQQPEELAALIRMEYLEMPDLKLTLRQAGRLWGAPADLCEAALGTLVQAGFLVQASNGAYLRRTSLPPSLATLVRAS